MSCSLFLDTSLILTPILFSLSLLHLTLDIFPLSCSESLSWFPIPGIPVFHSHALHPHYVGAQDPVVSSDYKFYIPGEYAEHRILQSQGEHQTSSDLHACSLTPVRRASLLSHSRKRNPGFQSDPLAQATILAPQEWESPVFPNHHLSLEKRKGDLLGVSYGVSVRERKGDIWMLRVWHIW